ncbi:tripartite tricarboxylate transporter substrate-binding protein [Aquabacterium sp. A7-Y]|uniref:tripartite tricarboxylate transporter substrate-binding protein n=1 Tax=Aquabacterium sp. A7-Y TaxID=1349605 RepID=UPI00223CCC4C|nr:tripartite tricarboxylate transporter substrate-binding protein [Aquabacterium sp. A7-Y]MCW7538608.1 tripartite tricarboxylate transporter substrate-binding protein [Aquabacterium sp. A7-Y]
MQRRRILLAAGLSALAGAPAHSNNARPLRIVVPFAPGGSADIFPRLLAPRLSELLQRPVVVENRAGAGGRLGAELVARSAPDGNTIGVATVSTHAIGPAVAKRSNYDPITGFAPITCLVQVPNVLAVHPSVPAKDVKALIKLSRDPRRMLNYGSPGVGSLGHMMGELFKQATSTFMVHIPYSGGGPALQGAIAGQVQVIYDNLPGPLPHIKAGRLRALAVSWPQRIEGLDEVPTFKEIGVPTLNDPSWFGLVAPAGAPAEFVAAVREAASTALATPEIQSRITDLGGIAVGNQPAEFGRAIQSEFQKWRRVATAAKVSLDTV